jgi:hypothetical protein
LHNGWGGPPWGLVQETWGTEGRYDLDGPEWYYEQTTAVTPGVESWLAIFTDHPAHQLGYSYVTIDDKFRDYVRFRPTGTDSIWITIGRVDWSWVASANSANNWTPIATIVQPAIVSDDSFPFWSALVPSIISP